MNAPAHLTLAELLDYWLHEVELAQAESIEEHLFSCADCATRLEAVRDLGDAIVTLVRRGGLSSSATTALINRMARDRLNIRAYTLEPGDIVACTVAPQDDFLLGSFVLPEPGHASVDMVVLDGGGHEFQRMRDVPVDARTGRVMTFIAARPIQDESSMTWQYVLLTAGGEREIGRYTLQHTAMREA
jgi:hypothetical protein